MRKIVLNLFIFSLLSMPILGLAAAGGLQSPPEVGVFDALNIITKWIYTFLLGIVVVMILIGAFYYVTANGDPSKIKTGNHIITWALVGLVVAVLAYAIRSFVCTQLVGTATCG